MIIFVKNPDIVDETKWYLHSLNYLGLRDMTGIQQNRERILEMSEFFTLKNGLYNFTVMNSISTMR
jgi:hypothetical protein